MAHSVPVGPVMAPRVMAEGGAPANGEWCVVLQDSAIWLSVLCAGLLFVLIVGVLLATRHHRRRGQGGTGGSVTDWGQSLALTYKLRRETRRLSEENLRLWEERAELLKAFGRVVACLQQEVGQISGKALDPSQSGGSVKRE